MFPQRQVGELAGYLKKMTADSQRQVCWRVGYLKNGKSMDVQEQFGGRLVIQDENKTQAVTMWGNIYMASYGISKYFMS